MKIKLHNKIEISCNGKKLCFFNNMLSSVREKLKNLEPYNTFLALGTGNGLHQNSNFYLNNFIKSYKMHIDSIYDEIDSNNGIPFVKKTILINDSSLDGQFLTEAGITDSNLINPIIYNYFSLINNDCPNGIQKIAGIPISISVYIFLNLDSFGNGKFCLGHNKYVSFLLGNGLNENLYACRGYNIISNENPIYREKLKQTEKYPCTFSFLENSNDLTLTFSFDLGNDIANEIVLLVGDDPFARINVQEFRANLNLESEFSPKTNYVIDLGENIKSVSNVFNNNTQTTENNVFYSKYASDFGDKITLPFYNFFDNQTPRFLSKDGKMIFFVYQDKIYGYINENYAIKKIQTNGICIQNIINIVSFDNFVFVFSKSAPYIFAYKIQNYQLSNCIFDFSGLANTDLLSSIYKTDIVLGKNNKFMIAIIVKENYYGYVLYLDFDGENDTFIFDSMISDENQFTYILGMQKNNFTDSMIMLLKEDELPHKTKLDYFYPDKTFSNLYSTLAVYFTEDAREVYTKNRAVIVEKNTSPYIWVYFYPQKYRYTLSLFGDELNDYIATNLHYLIQKMSVDSYKIYNLVGYNTPTEFENGFPSEIDQSNILDFEFLNDTLLIFLNDKKEHIVAYNLFENNMLIENVSSNSDTYLIEYEKFNLIGQNNEGVIVNFTIEINV